MSNSIDKFESSFERFNAVVAACVAASVGIFTILVPFDLLLRKLRLGGLEWLNEGAEYFLFFGVFLSATWVLQRGAHVRVDVVISKLPPRAAAWLERAIDMVGAILCLAMALFGYEGTVSAYVLGTLPDKNMQIPNWIILVVFTVSFLMLAIEFLLRFRRAGQLGYVAEESVGF